MESTNYQKLIRNFITQNEADLILNWVESINTIEGDPNYHLSHLSEELKGSSNIFDISQNTLTKYITKFQSTSKVLTEELPDFIHDIIKRISHSINLPTDNIFLQVVDQRKGGKIGMHYDASLNGYINYKCNLCILSEPYKFYMDKISIDVNPLDLYCFEASLYKHWTDEFKSRRVFLSFGFIIPYSVTGRTDDDPRVRLSKRIEKYFQSNLANQ